MGGSKMVAFNNQKNGQNEEDRALEKIHEEIGVLGEERMRQIVGSILVLVETQLQSQMGGGYDPILTLDREGLEDKVWGIYSEFFGA